MLASHSKEAAVVEFVILLPHQQAALGCILSPRQTDRMIARHVMVYVLAQRDAVRCPLLEKIPARFDHDVGIEKEKYFLIRAMPFHHIEEEVRLVVVEVCRGVDWN